MFEIKTGKMSEPFTCLIYGISGIGKTTLASKAPNPIILDCEEGSSRLEVARVSVTKNADLFPAMTWAAKQEYQTVVIDSTTAIQKMLIEIVLRDNKWPNLQKPGFGKGDAAVVECWQRILNGVKYIKASGKNCILIGHARTKTFQDPMLEAYDRYEPDVLRHAISPIAAALDAVFFYRYRTHVRESDDEKRFIAIGGDDRELYTQEQPAFIAKNRYNLEPVIENPTSKLFERMI